MNNIPSASEIENAPWSQILELSTAEERTAYPPEIEAALAKRESWAKDDFYREMNRINNSTRPRSPSYSRAEFDALEKLVGILAERKTLAPPVTSTPANLLERMTALILRHKNPIGKPFVLDNTSPVYPIPSPQRPDQGISGP